MRKMVLTVLVIAALAACTSRPPEETFLENAATALGSATVNTIQYSGSGTNFAYGQAYVPGGAWPPFKVTSYTAVIDYNAPAMRVELDRTNPDGEIRGGGGTPLIAPQKQIQVVRGDKAWNVGGNGNATPAGPGPASWTPLPDRLLNIWKSPQGVIKAAQKAGPEAKVTMEPGGGAVVTYPAAGLTVKATFNAEHLVERAETTVDDPIYGDSVQATMYSDYKDFGGVKFPTHIVQTQSGHPVLDITVTDVQINPPVTIDEPENIKTTPQPTAAPRPVEITKVADGVIFLSGQGSNGAAIEFNDHVVMWEASDNDAWATNRFEAVRKAFPGKPIRYVVNTHHHSDHSGGLRTAVAEGVTILTSEQNKDWWEKVVAMPHTINPDRLSKDPKPPVFEFIGDKKVLTDGVRTLEIHRLMNFAHADDMLVGYLPKEKILFETDMYDPPGANQPRPKVTPPVLNPRQVYLLSEIERLKLDVKQFVPGHGGIAPFDDLPLITGKKPVKAAAAN